jgi:uncharacterized metal-binding protein YceD (DUF177 family)
MLKDISSIKVGPVWNGGSGATFKEQIEAQPDLGMEIKLLKPLTADIMIVRMKKGISVVLSNLETCSRCLDNFSEKLKIASAEAHFYEEAPQKEIDMLDAYLVQTRDMSIDLTDAIRQEIILHFPMIPVCSERCKGLCSNCAVNLNHQQHRKGCQGPEKVITEETETETYLPFANLKDLMKKKN